MNYIRRFLLFVIKLYKFRKNKLDSTTHVSFKAALSNVTAKKYTRFAAHSDVRNTIIDEYTTIGRYTKITHAKLGKFCAISWDCTINATSHPYTYLTVHAFPYVPHAGGFVNKRVQFHREVVIGNDVWIGANSVITPGIKIGDGVVVGAGAVVTKNVPPYAIVVGVPAKVIKYRFSEDVIKKLLEIKWWDLDRAIIESNIDMFQGELRLEDLKKLEKYASH